MIILDTDYLSVFEYPEGDQAVRVRDRLRLSADRQISTTAVALEEQIEQIPGLHVDDSIRG